MTSKYNGLIVYHASYKTIDKIDLSFSKVNNDFGKGFYVTTDYNQAKKFAFLIAKRKMVDKAYINIYKLVDLNGLKVLEFKDANIDWLKCVSCFRSIVQTKDVKNYKDKDVIIGKVADDNTNFIINAYIRGVFGEVNNKKAIDAAVSGLKTDKLKDQLCFKTLPSLKKLLYVKTEGIKYAKN